MLNSLEQIEGHGWSSHLKNLGAISSVGYSVFQPTPLSLITALALSILAVSQKLTQWACPKSLTQHVVTKLVITLSLAFISAVALSALFGFPVAGGAVFVQAACIALPTLVVYCIELILDSRNKAPDISSHKTLVVSPPEDKPLELTEITLKPKEFSSALQEQRDSHHHQVDVTGSSHLSYNKDLTSLPEKLTVDGNLKIEGCTSLKSPPEDEPLELTEIKLKPKEFLLALQEQRDFHHHQVIVTGSLHLSYKEEITALPENLKVCGDLKLMGCEGLESLHGNLSVEGDVWLNECIQLTSLPENLEVGGNLNLMGCRSLVSLSGKPMIGGNVDLSRCTGLTHLPIEWTLKGDLNLNGCTGLKALPEKLSVEGNLKIEGCKSLKSLPETLRVGTGLYAKGCRDLEPISDKIYIGDRVYR